MIHKKPVTNNYSCFSNGIFNDDRLSRKARFLLLELLSKPSNWNVNFKHLINSGKEGERAVRAGINELIAVGYIHREIPRDNGRLGKTEYHIFDRHITNEEFQTLINADQEDRPKVTPPGDYPNHQCELSLDHCPNLGGDNPSPNLDRPNSHAEVTKDASNLRQPKIHPNKDTSPRTLEPRIETHADNLPMDKTAMCKTAMDKTATIINTDILITRES